LVWSTVERAPKMTFRLTVAVLLESFWLSVASTVKESVPV
jgi:hypothetical protein